MPWFYLLISALLEAVWASALGMSNGLTHPGYTALFLVALTIGMMLLALATRSIPISTAYGIWTGLGAAFTVTWTISTGQEPATFLRFLFLAMIVGSAIGLKATTRTTETKEAPVE